MRPVTHAAASGIAAALSLLPLQPARGQRVLAYHAIGTELPFQHYGISIATDQFIWQMRQLASRMVVPLGDAGAFALTFDDGYRDFMTIAAPLLAELKLPATLFVTTGFARSGSGLYLDPGEIRTLASMRNIELGAHGVTHRRLTECSDAELRDELRNAPRTIEDWSGRAVTAIAYPHGAVDRRVREAAAEMGYRIGCTTRFGVNGPASDRLLLNRTEIIASDSRRDFFRKLQGHWDWWRWRQCGLGN